MILDKYALRELAKRFEIDALMFVDEWDNTYVLKIRKYEIYSDYNNSRRFVLDENGLLKFKDTIFRIDRPAYREIKNYVRLTFY